MQKGFGYLLTLCIDAGFFNANCLTVIMGGFMAKNAIADNKSVVVTNSFFTQVVSYNEERGKVTIINNNSNAGIWVSLSHPNSATKETSEFIMNDKFELDQSNNQYIGDISVMSQVDSMTITCIEF